MTDKVPPRSVLHQQIDRFEHRVRAGDAEVAELKFRTKVLKGDFQAAAARVFLQSAMPFSPLTGQSVAGNVATAKTIAEGLLSGSTGLSERDRARIIDRLREQCARTDGDTVHVKLEDPDGKVVFDHNVDKATATRIADLLSSVPEPDRNKVMTNVTAAVAMDDAKKDLLAKLKAWLAQPFILRRPAHSVTHKSIEALGLTAAKYCVQDGSWTRAATVEAVQVILVEHDWASLLGSAAQSGTGSGEWRPPYDQQAFEFAISGAAVVAMVAQDQHQDAFACTMSVCIRPPGTQEWLSDRCSVRLLHDRWTPLVGIELAARSEPDLNAGCDRLFDFLFAQVRATAVMIDAEVAVTEAIRAPYKTNQPPKDRKPLPPLSHHVVKLNRRPRPSPLARDPGHEPGARRRLHFRRGHWRHYSAHKTWIKWMLVGDPDLGFVDKEYRT